MIWFLLLHFCQYGFPEKSYILHGTTYNYNIYGGCCNFFAIHKRTIFLRRFRLYMLLGMPIPRRFSFLGDSGNRGMAICHSSGIGETKTYSPGFGSGFGGISGSTLSQIWSQFEISLYWKDFFRKFFLNRKNSMIFMIRNVKISIKDNQI